MKRLRFWLCAGALAPGALGGCKSQNSQYEQPPGMQAPGSGVGGSSSQSQVGRFFSPGKSTGTGIPQEPVQVRAAHKKGEGFTPVGEVGMATVRLDAAMMKTEANERDQLLDMARQGYGRAIKGDPKNAEAYAGLARLYSFTGDRDNAVATLRMGMQHLPQDHTLAHKLAGIQFKFGDYAGAEQTCQVALRSDPKNRSYLKTLAVCQAHQGQWDAAYNTLVANKAMTEAEARYFMGRTLLDVGQLEEGRAQIAMSAQLDPNYALARQTLADLDAGVQPPGQAVMQAGATGTER